MTWLLLSLLSALTLGLYDVAKKSALDQNAVLAVLFASSVCGVACVLPAGILSLLTPALATRVGVAVEPLGAVQHGLLVAKAGIVTLSWVLTFFAIKHLPISIAAPLRATAPLFVLLGAALVLGERLSPMQWVGVAAILVSYWCFSLIGRAEGIHFGRDRWVWLMLAGTLVAAASAVYDKHLLQAARIPAITVQFWFTIYNAALQGLILCFTSRAYPSSERFRWRWQIAAVAVLLLISDSLYFNALAAPSALVSVVSTIRRSNVVVSFVLGGLAFRERNRRVKAGALMGVLAGLVLLMR